MDAAKEYVHGEAFCLMWYRCKSCEHAERIWNARDGVTPFGTICPSCGAPDLLHVDWKLDECAPEHKLHPGQKFWRNGRREEARAAIERRIELFAERGQPVPPDVQKSMLADLEKPSAERWEFKDGWPMLDIHMPA